MTILSTAVGKNLLEESSPHSQQESKMQFFDAISKVTMISVHFQGKPFNITVIQVYLPTTNAEEVEVEEVHEDLQDFLELTRKRGVSSPHNQQKGLTCSTW